MPAARLAQVARNRLWRRMLPRFLARACAAVLPLFGPGCAQFVPSAVVTGRATPIIRASGQEIIELPPVQNPAAPAPGMVAEHREIVGPRPLAINLDTVLRLADGQNAKIAEARARVQEAFAGQDLARLSWLPAVNVGPSYYRHEGGITNDANSLVGYGTLDHASYSTLFAGLAIDGKLDLKEAVFLRVNAERQVWQQKGELQRVTSETLLDAASSYIDLLAALTGEQIALGLQRDLERLLANREKLEKIERGAEVEVATIRSQVRNSERAIVELREQAARVSAKLAYWLGVDPSLTLVPVDARLVPLELVDTTPPVADLTAQALAQGPGVREMEGILNLVQQTQKQANGPGRFIPVFDLQMLEGGFGSGPGDDMRWDNRWDLVLQARWNLTDLLTACDRRRILQAKADQAHWAYEDLRGKLTAGVQEAREAIVQGRTQLRLAEEAITDATRSYELSDKRLANNVVHEAREVLMSLQALSQAQLTYLNALRAYDKAQLRLMILLGGPNGHACCH
jgi:outer membrane protein TolC